MKYIILVILSLNSFNAMSQDPELVNTNWYLSQLVINGENFTPPQNEELNPPELEFLDTSDNSYPLLTCVCFCYAGEVIFSQDLIFLPDGLAFIPESECQMQDNIDFDSLYADVFFQHESTTVSDSIAYEIETDGEGNRQLTLTNSNGDMAIYGDQLLSITDYDLDNFTILKNPVEDILALTFLNSNQEVIMEIYDVLGELHSSKTIIEGINFTQDVSGLTSGMYLVVVTDGATKSVKKFVKQ